MRCATESILLAGISSVDARYIPVRYPKVALPLALRQWPEGTTKNHPLQLIIREFNVTSCFAKIDILHILTPAFLVRGCYDNSSSTQCLYCERAYGACVLPTQLAMILHLSFSTQALCLWLSLCWRGLQ